MDCAGHPETLNHLDAPGAPDRIVTTGASVSRSLVSRASSWGQFAAQRWLHRLDPAMPQISVALRILCDREVRSVVREADVIDLQWIEAIRLHRLVRLT